MEFPCFDPIVMIFIGCSIFNSHEFQCEKWGQYNAGIYKEKEAVIQSPPRSPRRDQFLPLFTLSRHKFDTIYNRAISFRFIVELFSVLS